MGKQFWLGLFERALKTFIQTFVAVLGVTAGVTYTAESFRGLPWESALITAGVAAILSVATSFGNPTFVAGKPKTTVVDSGLVPPDDGGMVEPHSVDVSDPGMIEPVDDADLGGYVPRRAAESEVGTVESTVA
ncbi:holin [Propionibacterium phage PHL163M00]|uniref:Putative holin n=4 Tax=Pahexavirus TaxID=1982251 RepID=A0A0E3DNL9_9CAUD|nr:holin [Propionibacterium phage PHL194M00]YP_009153225.1 holin [Propionibacterium phage PHL055N00]YP_009153579.1 holin [Propionibacterium phage PHL117M00]YP_009153895.1 holin [Propionibacterium phage PHL163M00]AII28782.1 putative holin [Propionibacterium phage PHL055N00]AII29511.1 putative holin [Propionibacterium phage PHL117M00]AII29871.1 putative holin [Propionibacterium phage PHL163M00]AII30007.1 putative holin [Propionibacterium phage PHL194M00]